MSDQPIKVLSVCTSDSSGGAARAAYRIHQAVRELGVDSRMFVKHKGTDDPTVLTVDDFIPHNALYRGFDWARNKVKNKWQHYQWGKYPDRQKFFMSDLRSTDIGHALQKIDYDILHLHWVNLRFLPLEQLPKDKPIVWTLHDSWPFCGVCHYFGECRKYKSRCDNCPQLASDSIADLSNRVWLKKKNCYQDLDLHIVTPSHWLGECSKQSGLLGKFPTYTIPNPLDTNIFRPIYADKSSQRWSGLLERKNCVRYILYGAMNATTDERKGFSFLVSALQYLENSESCGNIELIIFGSDKALTDFTAKIPIHNVGMINNVEELVSLYNLADVTVVPSLEENLSCVIMESLSCGTPVVAFAIGGNGDLIDQEINGYLTREKNGSNLANGIRWCLENNKEGYLSINARKKVLDNYTPKIVGAQYKDLYHKLQNLSHN